LQLDGHRATGGILPGNGRWLTGDNVEGALASSDIDGIV